MCHSSGCSPISCVHHSAILQSPAQHAVVPQRGGSTFVRCHLMTTLCTVGLRLVSRELRAMKRRLFLILTLIRHRGDVKARLLRHWLAGSICQSPTRLPWPSPCKLFGGRSVGEAQFRPGTSSRMGVPRGRSDDHFRVGSGRCGSASGRPTTGVIAEGPPVFHVLNVLFPLLSCPASFSSPALLSSSPACFPLLCVFHLLFFSHSCFLLRFFFPPYCFGLIFLRLVFPFFSPLCFPVPFWVWLSPFLSGCVFLFHVSDANSALQEVSNQHFQKQFVLTLCNPHLLEAKRLLPIDVLVQAKPDSSPRHDATSLAAGSQHETANALGLKETSTLMVLLKTLVRFVHTERNDALCYTFSFELKQH